MTTIATDGKSMAGDSMTSAGGEVTMLAPKVHRMDNGSIIGCAGDTTDCRAFVRYMREQKGERPSLGENFDALILHPNGNVEWMDHKWEPLAYTVPNAIGSGGRFAIGAMMAGASPKEAVRIACERDTCSGGPITSMKRREK